MKTELSIAVIGMGDVGWKVAQEIAKIEKVYDKYIVTNLIICSRDEQKAENLSDTLRGIKKGNSWQGFNVKHFPLHDLGRVIPPADIVINCASSTEEKQYKPDRRKMGLANLELSRMIAKNIPDSALEIIVTNDVSMLPQDLVASGRDHSLTIGKAQIDAIRAGIAIEKFVGDSIPGPIDKSNIFMMGSHNDGEMILAHKTSTLNGIALKELKSIEGKYFSIQQFATDFAKVQVQTEGDTSVLTAEAVMQTLSAVLTESSYVSASVLCDFTDDFFKADPLYNKFRKPTTPMYMVMRTGFSDLRAGFFAGQDTGDERYWWFCNQAEETKKAFYDVALKQTILFGRYGIAKLERENNQ